MTVKIDSRFVTVDETADVLGVSSRRVKELRKIIECVKEGRRASGISWIAPAASSRSLGTAPVHFAAKKRKSLSAKLPSKSARAKSVPKSKELRGTKRRGKKSKTAR
jgi:hypothetical protein